jgi:hypothetical protein
MGLFWSSRAQHGCWARVGAGAEFAPLCRGSLHHPYVAIVTTVDQTACLGVCEVGNLDGGLP